ncbi:MAG: PilZ domain-containing protein [Deltaproteobacteria bacterium]|nr:MAG: PilZ domain-containing protein [Deltaproteobacteria bacterium]
MVSRKKTSSAGAERRRFPRRPADIKVKLRAWRRDDVVFEATLPTQDLSIGGIFLQSEFFIKPGTRLRAEFQLEEGSELVAVEGVVVRQERVVAGSRRVRSGFAIQFVDYLEDAKQVLARHFLAPAVREFVEKYLRSGRPRKLRSEDDRLVDVVVAWELDCFDRGRALFKP